MTCSSCQIMRKVSALLAECHRCDANRSTGGHSLVQASDWNIAHQAIKVESVQSVTHLDREDEDALHRALVDLLTLNPIELLLFRHLFTGRPLATFTADLEKIARRVRGYKTTSARATAHAMKESIARKFPQIADALDEIVRANERRDRSKASPPP